MSINSIGGNMSNVGISLSMKQTMKATAENTGKMPLLQDLKTEPSVKHQMYLEGVFPEKPFTLRTYA